MRHHIFSPNTSFHTAILIKASSFRVKDLATAYVQPLAQMGVPASGVIAFTLQYGENGKAPVKLIKEYLDSLLPELDALAVTHLYVADAAYFKVLAKQPKADSHLGYVLPCAIKDYEHMQVTLGVNHQALIYNPELQAKLDMSLNALATSLNGSYTPLGGDIIKQAAYPKEVSEIAAVLKDLHKYPELTCDIETFSLKFKDAGIGTIAFAWDQHNGVAFACDYSSTLSHEEMREGLHGSFQPRQAIRELLREFFETYQGKLTWHGATFDLKVLIYTLWMEHPLDNQGLLQGLEIMTRMFDDTKIIAYLATNSTAGNVLGLKPLAHEFAGNWAKDDIKDICRIPLADLLQYNLVDTLSTWYVKKKYTPIMEADNQREIYDTLMLPSQVTIIQMELTGMPIQEAALAKARRELEIIQEQHLKTIHTSPLILAFNLLLQISAQEAANAKLKVKQHPLEKFAGVQLNPNSPLQLQRLLYEQLCLPVLDTTDTGQPSTGEDTLKKLINHTPHQEVKDILNAIIEYGKATKVLSTFIPAFYQGFLKEDERMYLHGSFNLGGTVSGRLSSSDPNMQNIPAGSAYGKLIKECFVAPEGWIFCGADFNSLEDYISALTTRDPNKLAVYERGFDGHSLRAAYYFQEDLAREGIIIDLNDPASVNTLKETEHWTRQESKAPTFLLTYGGTYHGMMSNLGWDQDKSQAIEANYHALYKVSDEYVEKRLEQASKDGYVEVAFGLRVRTPLLKQVIFKGHKMPFEAAAEGRTAGNALGQSYGLLNNRAANAFMKKVRASKYRNDVKICALIHDAIYLLVRDNIEVVEWVNRELIKEMQWQELPEIQHPTVKLGAALDLFWPSWANAITLPNEADTATIRRVCEQGVRKYQEKQAA